MCDFEFRAKDCASKEWRYGFYSMGINPDSGEQTAYIQTVNGDGTFGETVIVDKNTVGVWIGKKDKTGRRIYTDDILRMRMSIGYAVGYVTFESDNGAFVLRNDRDSWSCGIKGGMSTEIMGNLHDTPELVEGAA